MSTGLQGCKWILGPRPGLPSRGLTNMAFSNSAAAKRNIDSRRELIRKRLFLDRRGDLGPELLGDIEEDEGLIPCREKAPIGQDRQIRMEQAVENQPEEV